MKRFLLVAISLMILSLFGCAAPEPPQWNDSSGYANEYSRYMLDGDSSLSGQAFLVQRGGATVKAAGRTVTLDPSTTTGKEYWEKAGRSWVFRTLVPPSPEFNKARRITTADAEGRFSFKNIPAGSYFVRSSVTWHVPDIGIQGGIVGKPVEVKEGQNTEVVLGDFAI